MALQMNCPSCGQLLLLDEKQTGRSVRCPACDNVFSSAARSRSQGIATQPQTAPERAVPQRVALPRQARPAASRGGIAGLVLGTLALVVGMMALCISWVPFVCVAALVGAGIGLVLGFAGALTSLIQKRFLGLGLSLAAGAVNLLALLVALIVTIVSGASFGSIHIATLSDPPAEAILPEWGQVFDPDGDCTVEQQGAKLNIHVPPKPHDLSAELGLVNAPRVLDEVEGDFVAQVKVCGSIHPTADAAVPGRVSFQSAGLLLWENPRNYIRLERSALNRDGPVQTYASLEMRTHALPWAAQPVGLVEQDTYLRLERRGDQILGSVSEDGKQWTLLQPLNAALPRKVQIGVAAVNAAQQPLQVRFEEFRIEKK